MQLSPTATGVTRPIPRSRNTDYGLSGTIPATPLHDRTSDAFWTVAATRITAAPVLSTCPCCR